MFIMNVEVLHAEVVEGNTIHPTWKDEMVRVITEAGVFIDYGYKLYDWLEMIGTTPRIGIQPCERTYKHTWVHLLRG